MFEIKAFFCINFTPAAQPTLFILVLSSVMSFANWEGCMEVKWKIYFRQYVFNVWKMECNYTVFFTF